MKLLLNAESFGFGPSAAIACIFPELKKLNIFDKISYIGQGHSLELQESLDYDNIYDLSLVCDKQQQFKSIMKNYDVFLTALDFQFATWAKEMGKKIIIYDTLTWYWHEINPVVHHADIYIAQDFYGVKERILQEKISNYHIISPLVHPTVTSKADKEIVFVNFGGLKNPFWENITTASYVEKINSLLNSFLENSCVLKIASRQNGDNISHISYSQVQEKIASAYCAFTTPGLGNILEMSHYKIPTLFLPPANDSQGRQLHILKDRGIIEHFIDWCDLGFEIDYFQQQSLVLEKIKYAIENLIITDQIQSIVSKKIKAFKDLKSNSLPDLIKNLGSNGRLQFCQIIEKWSNHVSI